MESVIGCSKDIKHYQCCTSGYDTDEEVAEDFEPCEKCGSPLRLLKEEEIRPEDFITMAENAMEDRNEHSSSDYPSTLFDRIKDVVPECYHRAIAKALYEVFS